MRWLFALFQPKNVGLLDSAVPPQDLRDDRAFKISSAVSQIKTLQSSSPSAAQKVIDRVHRMYWYYKEAANSKDSDLREFYDSFIKDKRLHATVATGAGASFFLYYLNKLADATMSTDNCVRPQAYMSQSSQMIILLLAVLGVQTFFRLNYEQEKTDLNNAVIDFSRKETYYKDILEGIGRRDLTETKPDIAASEEMSEAAFAPF